MTDTSQQTFRPTALQRANSPEQLDFLVEITRPLDWIAMVVIAVALAAAIAWGLFGRIPTRASGEGILVGSGRVVEAVSAAAGRLGELKVGVGDRVSSGQVIAQIDQTEIRQRHRNATEVFSERRTTYQDLTAKVAQELETKAANYGKLETALQQVIKATEQRIEYLAVDVKNLEDLLSKGFTTRKILEDRRLEYTQAQQRRDDAHNEILKLRAQKTDLETQRARDVEQAQYSLNDARRQVDELAGMLNQNSQVMSPIAGRVLETKVSAGSVLTVGTPILAVEDEGEALEAMIYIPSERGKSVTPGMQVNLEPSFVKREEFGTMLGQVASVSEFPITPQGMAAVLHNDSLVKRFSEKGAPYAATINLTRDSKTFSGFRWAVGKGPNTKLTSGTLIRAEIITREQRPFDLVLPLIKRLTGTDG